MKIVTIIRRFLPAKRLGPERHAQLLSRKLVERGHNQIVFTSTSGLPKEINRTEEIDGISIKRYRPILDYGHITLTPQMIGDLMREEADIIHVHGYRNFQTEVGALVSRLRNIPLVMTPHGSFMASFFLSKNSLETLPNLLYDKLTQTFAIKKAKCVVTSCRREALEAVKFGVPKEKIRIIPLGADLPPHIKVHRHSFRNREKNTVLFVGRIAPTRNIEFLMESFKLVLKEVHNIKLIIVGEDVPSRYTKDELSYKSRILELCKKLGITDNIIFTGWLSGRRLWDTYLNSDVFVWPSKYDSFGYALVEAALCGRPIVSTRVGVAPDLIGLNKGGILVDHNDIVGMKNAIVSLLCDESLYRTAQETLLRRSKEFSVDKMVHGYERLYEELASA